MKLSIRMKIFLPVVILLIGFPLATWATLRYSLEVQMNFNARRDLEAMVRTVDGGPGGAGGRRRRGYGLKPSEGCGPDRSRGGPDACGQ